MSNRNLQSVIITCGRSEGVHCSSSLGKWNYIYITVPFVFNGKFVARDLSIAGGGAESPNVPPLLCVCMVLILKIIHTAICFVVRGFTVIELGRFGRVQRTWSAGINAKAMLNFVTVYTWCGLRRSTESTLNYDSSLVPLFGHPRIFRLHGDEDVSGYSDCRWEGVVA